MAHKFLSAIVIQLVQSELNEINQSVLLQNIHPASILVQYSLVQDDVGIVGVSLKLSGEELVRFVNNSVNHEFVYKK